MSLLSYTIGGGGGGGGGIITARHRSLPSPPPWTTNRRRRATLVVAQARKGISSRTRRLEKRGNKGPVTTTTTTKEGAAAAEAEMLAAREGLYSLEDLGVAQEAYSTEPMPVLPGEEKNFWEGEQWEAFGFFVQYMWAFGVLFALVACGIAVATYNEGATDYKKTTVYQESIQSRGLLEEPEASNSDVFEANPTEEAPSLE